MTRYNPQPETAALLNRALAHIESVPYTVTARWVFYRLLQEGSLPGKADYKRLLGYMSHARKGWWGGWTPETLADDTRSAVVRGEGFSSGAAWLEGVKRMRCDLDHWSGQLNYVECWFEASAMQAQFKHYTNENITLLSFKGDISIPAKMASAQRLYKRMRDGQNIVILYYGDLDPKGLQIPESATRDVFNFIARLWGQDHRGIDLDQPEERDRFRQFLELYNFRRVGLNPEHVDRYSIVENPERPGSYQWEGLDDAGAEELIGEANDHIDMDLLAQVTDEEDDITRRFREHLDGLDLEE